MKGPRLTELPIRQLEHIFSPPGLPLPAKGESEHGTTSILVRGGAGTGKTTFALALAHAIARTGGGVVLYLTTEFSPVEIAFKATLIGLPEERVEVWPGAPGMQPGDVAVVHLSAVRRGPPVLTSAERKRSSIDAIWGLLHPEKPGETRPPLPVRAVVIDALTLPEAGETEGALRAYLVEFVQALEHEGISSVLVEELSPGSPAWSAFVVDVVFELSFQPDPETQELRRKLTLSKCRYSLSSPGPHDYGIDHGVPGIWPDLFRVITGGHGEAVPRLRIPNPVRLVVPYSEEGQWARLQSGILLSAYDMTSDKAIKALKHTPGVGPIWVNCGAMTTVGSHPNSISVYDNEGPHAIAWAILILARKTGSNTCIFQDLDGLLTRPGSTTLVLHMLEALTQLGLIVCVHSSSYDAFKPLMMTVDLVWGGADRGVVGPLPPRRHRPYARQIHKIPLNVGGNEAYQAAWLALRTGDDWQAAHTALAEIELDAPAPTMLLLWKAICAAIAHNSTAIDELKGALATPDEPLILDPLLRALAGTGQLDEADRIIADLGARRSLAPWMLDRLRADARLDSQTPAVLEDAAARLLALVDDESPPPMHRAETWHNLGTAYDRLGKNEAAIAAFERAAALETKGEEQALLHPLP